MVNYDDNLRNVYMHKITYVNILLTKLQKKNLLNYFTKIC